MDNSAIGKDSMETSAAAEAQRRDTRDSLLVLAQLKHEGEIGGGVTVRVRNVSSGGLMAEVGEDYRPGDRIEVTLEGPGTVSGAVAWAEAGRIGVAFDHPIDKSRARKSKGEKAKPQLFRPMTADYKRPPLKPR